MENTTPLPRTSRGLGKRSRPEGEGSGRADGGGIQREEGKPRQENPGSDRDLVAQVEEGKGEATG